MPASIEPCSLLGSVLIQSVNIAQAGLQLLHHHTQCLCYQVLFISFLNTDKPVGGNNTRAAYLEATVHPGRDGMTAEGTLVMGAKGIVRLDHNGSGDRVLSRDQRNTASKAHCQQPTPASQTPDPKGLPTSQNSTNIW